MKTSTNCPACTGKLALWHGIWAGTPFRMTCPHCRARLRIDLPWLVPVFWALVVGFAALGVGIGYLAASGRFVPVVYMGIGMVIAWLVLELVGGVILYTYASFTILYPKTPGETKDT